MMLIAGSIALLALYAGTKLLLLSKKENQGMLYKFISWFIMLMGLGLFVCSTFMVSGRCCESERGSKHSDCSSQKSCATSHHDMQGAEGMSCHKGGKACAHQMSGKCCMANSSKCNDSVCKESCGDMSECMGKSGKDCCKEKSGEGMMKNGAACCKKDSLKK